MMADNVAEQHEAECQCDAFSDCYKDVTGYRPRDNRWTCTAIISWFAENYIECDDILEPRVPFKDRPK